MGKLLFSFWLLFGTWQIQPWATSGEEILFQKANQFYNQQQYGKAVAQYEQLYHNGVNSESLYCNLANAYFKLGKESKARLFYEKAFCQNPLQEEILKNKIQISSPKEGSQTSIILGINANIFTIIKAVKFALQLGVLLLFAGSIAFFLSVFKKERRYQKFLKPVVKTALAGALVCLAFGGLGYKWLKPSANTLILLRNSPGKAGPSVLAKTNGSLGAGEKVLAANYFEGWYKVKTSGGQAFWVNRQDLTPIAE